MSSGIPEILQNIQQKVRPPLKLGWGNRLKSSHFRYYQQVAEEFSKVINIDPWLINPLFQNCENVDFLKREGMSCLTKNTEKLFNAIQEKYDEYNIEQEPFVILKADAGTYGMSVMTIHHPNELDELNRKQRTKMSASKGGNQVNKVILQEGVYTFETLGEEKAVAEPVVYMLGQHVVGGFYRVHENRSATENLNAPGMHFKPLAFAKCCNNPNQCLAPDSCVNRFYAYGVIARVSLLAAAREQQAGLLQSEFIRC